MGARPTAREGMDSHKEGHRSRLRGRFLKSSFESIPDYELLEVLLFLSNPRADMKPVAKNLMEKFKTLTGIFQAVPEDLLQVKGVGESVCVTFRAIHLVAQRISQESLKKRAVFSSLSDLVRHCRLRIVDPSREQFHVMYLDKKGQLIGEESHQVGTIDATMVYPREIIKKALGWGASGLVLVHNHPSGDCTPSSSDVELTRYIAEAGKMLGIEVMDHIIISAVESYSMAQQGMI